MANNRMVETVTGPVAPDKLGKCLTHEHFVFGYPGWQGDSKFQREAFIAKAVQEMEVLKAFGVVTIVDATPADCGRDPLLLKEISLRSGMNIVCTAGYYHEKEGATAYFKFRMAYGDAPTEVYEMLRREVTEGIGDTGVKAGILKVASGLGEITPYEELFLEAIAQVAREEDMNITTHTQGGTMGAEQARRLIACGVKPERIMIGHLDNCADLHELMNIFEQGVYGGFDRLGIQGFTGALPESRRLAAICGMAASGYDERIILSHDSLFLMLGHAWNYSPQDAKDLKNWHWRHVFEDVLPALKAMGLPPKTVDAFVEANPKAFFR